MKTIYTAQCTCKDLKNIGLSGYNDVVLGSSYDNKANIVIKGICAVFIEGKEYLVTISEM